MSWRLAKSLPVLTAQLNAKYGKNRKHDEGIGDEHHQGESFSDHNPDKDGVVRALDIYPSLSGLSPADLAEVMRLNRDPRIKYVISRRRLFSSPGYTTKYAPWVWRPYNGEDPHVSHMHISVLSPAKYYDDTRSWDLEPIVTLEPPIKVIVHEPDHPPPLNPSPKPITPPPWWQQLLKRLF